MRKTIVTENINKITKNRTAISKTHTLLLTVEKCRKKTKKTKMIIMTTRKMEEKWKK